jgi:hypothetical protein
LSARSSVSTRRGGSHPETGAGNYEFARRVLGHKNIQTTMRFYVGLEPLSANRRFGEIVSEHVTFADERV